MATRINVTIKGEVYNLNDIERMVDMMCQKATRVRLYDVAKFMFHSKIIKVKGGISKLRKLELARHILLATRWCIMGAEAPEGMSVVDRNKWVDLSEYFRDDCEIVEELDVVEEADLIELEDDSPVELEDDEDDPVLWLIDTLWSNYGLQVYVAVSETTGTWHIRSARRGGASLRAIQDAVRALGFKRSCVLGGVVSFKV